MAESRVSTYYRRWKRYAFPITWLVIVICFGFLISQGQASFDAPNTSLALLGLSICGVTLLWWLPKPDFESIVQSEKKKGLFFILVSAVVTAVLFFLRTSLGPALLFGFPVIGGVVAFRLRSNLKKREAGYAFVLALIAGLTALGAGWITDFSPNLWAVLQFLLTVTGLLAGWAILRQAGLLALGIGKSCFVESGLPSAMRRFGEGIVIAMPWALGLVLLGSHQGEEWVRVWWQPFIAIQPGIAEEAWGRMLLVPLLFVLLGRFAPTKRAFHVSIVILAYWFAYLHTPGGLESLISTLLIGTLFVLPVSYLLFRRDLETAIGFHFWLDFVKFVAAFIIST